MILLEVVVGLLVLCGLLGIIREYQYILDYKRDERIFHEYEKQNKDVLSDIVADPDNCPF